MPLGRFHDVGHAGALDVVLDGDVIHFATPGGPAISGGHVGKDLIVVIGGGPLVGEVTHQVPVGGGVEFGFPDAVLDGVGLPGFAGAGAAVGPGDALVGGDVHLDGLLGVVAVIPRRSCGQQGSGRKVAFGLGKLIQGGPIEVSPVHGVGDGADR